MLRHPQPPLPHRRDHAGGPAGRYILEDDYDAEFRFDMRPIPSLQGMAGPQGPVVYLCTFSKSLAPSIRIACMVLPLGLLERYRGAFGSYANTVSRFEQQTLRRFLEEGYFTRHLARLRSAWRRRWRRPSAGSGRTSGAGTRGCTCCCRWRRGRGRRRWSGPPGPPGCGCGG